MALAKPPKTTFVIYSYDYPPGQDYGHDKAQEKFPEVIHGRMTIETDQELTVFHFQLGRIGNNDGALWYIRKE